MTVATVIAGQVKPLRTTVEQPVPAVPQGCAEGLVCLVETRLGIDPNQAGIVKPGATMPGDPHRDSTAMAVAGWRSRSRRNRHKKTTESKEGSKKLPLF